MIEHQEWLETEGEQDAANLAGRTQEYLGLRKRDAEEKAPADSGEDPVILTVQDLRPPFASFKDAADALLYLFDQEIAAGFTLDEQNRDIVEGVRGLFLQNSIAPVADLSSKQFFGAFDTYDKLAAVVGSHANDETGEDLALAEQVKAAADAHELPAGRLAGRPLDAELDAAEREDEEHEGGIVPDEDYFDDDDEDDDEDEEDEDYKTYRYLIHVTSSEPLDLNELGQSVISSWEPVEGAFVEEEKDDDEETEGLPSIPQIARAKELVLEEQAAIAAGQATSYDCLICLEAGDGEHSLYNVQPGWLKCMLCGSLRTVQEHLNDGTITQQDADAFSE